MKFRIPSGIIDLTVPPATPVRARPNLRAESPPRLRSPEPADGGALWRIARDSSLDLNSPYAYVLWGDHFATTSVVAEVSGEVVGFVTGFRLPQDLHTLFVWQVAVHGSSKRAGLASQMLDHLVAELGDIAVLEATVTPSNRASARLFRSFAERHGAEVDETPAYGAELFPGDDHEPETRFRIGPLVARP